MRVVVVGGDGFIGSAVVRALIQHGHTALSVRAPRVRATGQRLSDLAHDADRFASQTQSLSEIFVGSDAVINAAGIADASSTDARSLLGANAVLPRLILQNARKAGVRRLLHVSSTAVQGRRSPITETSEAAPASLYGYSKAAGERLIESGPCATIFRPTSVHDVSRQMTRRMVRLLRSKLASVAGDGQRPTPQVLLPNVADAIVATVTAASPPRIVVQPSEGLTTADLVRVLGAHEPIYVPTPLAQRALAALYLASSTTALSPAVPRRLEMLWFGQEQEGGWLESVNWSARVGREGWISLGNELRAAI